MALLSDCDLADYRMDGTVVARGSGRGSTVVCFKDEVCEIQMRSAFRAGEECRWDKLPDELKGHIASYLSHDPFGLVSPFRMAFDTHTIYFPVVGLPSVPKVSNAVMATCTATQPPRSGPTLHFHQSGWPTLNKRIRCTFAVPWSGLWRSGRRTTPSAPVILPEPFIRHGAYDATPRV